MSEELKGKSVLVVDDDADIVTAISAALVEMGATVHSAGDGNRAVSLAQEKKPDLVILDIMLPQKSGFLVLEKLRQGLPRGEGPQIIMITGNEGRRHRQYAETLGVDGYLNKPFRMDRLREITAELLSG